MHYPDILVLYGMSFHGQVDIYILSNVIMMTRSVLYSTVPNGPRL